MVDLRDFIVFHRVQRDVLRGSVWKTWLYEMGDVQNVTQQELLRQMMVDDASYLPNTPLANPLKDETNAIGKTARVRGRID